MIEISQLQTLVTVAKMGSFSKAAEELQVTQSAISQSIKNLESKINIRIFKRSGKKVALTLEGEKIYRMGLTMIGQMKETLEEVQSQRDSMKGKVRIGTLTGIGKSWLAPIMLEYSEDFPEISVSLRLGHSEELLKDFEAYQLDFLILPEEHLPNIGEKILLGEEVSTLVFPDRKGFELDKKMTLEEFSNYPTILFSERGDHLYYKWCREKFGKTPRDINVRYVINSHGNMLQAVMRGLGIAVIPKHVLGRSYYRDKVKTLKEKRDVSNGRFFLVFHKKSKELMRIEKTIEVLTSKKNPFSLSGPE